MSRIDLVGQRFGSLLVVSYHSLNKHGGGNWLCQCDCGNTTVARSWNLRKGNTKSCGCGQGSTHKNSVKGKTRKDVYDAYRSWVGMRNRCSNPKNKLYRQYGGRGIAVSQEWSTFEAFLSDMGPRPQGATLGRIDNDLGYSKGNCRWEDKKEQERNKTTTRWVEFNGEKKALSEWCEIVGLPFHVVHYRLNAGWSVEKALTTPKACRSR